MNEIRFPTARAAVPPGPAGLQDCPGRNDPRYGAWMIETLIPKYQEFTTFRQIEEGEFTKPIIADPMCGGGQLWMLRPVGAQVYGCELHADRVAIARQNGIRADVGNAETWTPPEGVEPDLIGFSNGYENCDHNSGNTEHQRDLVREKGAQAMQAIDSAPCWWRVFAQIATYRGHAPVAVIAKNYVRGQAVVDVVGEIVQAGALAGLGAAVVYWRRIPLGMTEQWKVSSGKRSRITGAVHRAINLEHIVCFPAREEGAA